MDLGNGRTALQLVAGSFHTCARLDNGAVKCWGWNNFAQLGLGDTDARGDGLNATGQSEMGNNLPPVDLGNGRTALQLVAGNVHTCARLDNGVVKCWGWNNFGQLGLGIAGALRGDSANDNEMGDNLPPVDMGNGRTAVELVAGLLHNCARLDNGAVKCWGLNESGQLGLGDMINRGDGPDEMGDTLPPVDLGSSRTAVEIVAGSAHTCARLDNGRVKCWGLNSAGQLGLGDMINRGDGLNAMGEAEMGDNLLPVDLGSAGFFGSLTVLQLAAGGRQTCARLAEPLVAGPALLKCWGGNNFGQLGLGDMINRGDGLNATGETEMGDNLLPVDLGQDFFGNAPALDVSVSMNGTHTCGQLRDGAVKCWGFNNSGQLGLGDTDNRGDGLNAIGEAVDLGS